FFKEAHGQVTAMEADALVRILAVIIIPVEQRAWRSRSECQSVHAQCATDVQFAGAGHEVVAHRAHDGARYDTKEFLQCRPALYGRNLHVARLHPSVDHSAQLSHLDERSFWD